MDFSASSLIAGFIFGIIGLWLFREGGRRVNITLRIIGVLLMSYPLFTPTPLTTWLVGAGLCYWAYLKWE